MIIKNYLNTSNLIRFKGVKFILQHLPNKEHKRCLNKL